MNEDTTDWSRLKHIANHNFGPKKKKLFPGSHRCCACRIEINRPEYQVILFWVPRRAGEPVVMCTKCANRIWPLLQGSSGRAES